MIDQAEVGSDAIGIVAYDGTATVVQPVTLIDSKATRDALTAQLATIQIGGTNAALGAALETALNEIRTSSDSDAGSVFLFTSNSLAGSTLSFEVIEDYQDAGIPIFTFDYGVEGNAATLSQTLAEETGGTYSAVPSFPNAILALAAAQSESTPDVEVAITQNQISIAGSATETVPFGSCPIYVQIAFP